MYTGTLIDELMAAVERAEEHALADQMPRDERVAFCYVPAAYEMSAEPNFLGAA